MKTTARRWSAIGMILTTMMLGAATRAAAQQTTTPQTTEITPGEWSVTPFIGFGFSGDLDSATGAVGIAGGYGWSPTVTFEGEFNLLPASENNGLVEVNSKAWSLGANLLYHFAPRPFRPYGVIGLGVGHATVDARSSVALQFRPVVDGVHGELRRRRREADSRQHSFPR